jgi:methionyl-tRNA formyltransferase
MVKKADAGDIVGQRSVDIEFHDTARMLYGKLCAAAEQLLDDLLPLIKTGRTPRRPQDESLATTFPGRRRSDGRIDWQWPAVRIYNLIRAVTDPYPGALTRLPGDEEMVVWWGLPEEAAYRPDRPGVVGIRGETVLVGAGEGGIRLLDVEISGTRYRGAEIYAYFKGKEGIKLT